MEDFLEEKKNVSSLAGCFAAKLAQNSGIGLETKKFTVSHAGKQHSYHLAHALLQLGVLQGFYTSSYVESPLLQSLILRSGNQFFSRRFKAGLASPYVHSHWGYELKEFWMRKRYGKTLAVQNQVYQRDTDFDLMMARKLPSLASTHFWGFQGSCHASLSAARASGKTAICELATAHVVQARKILSEEAKLLPEWADSIDNLYFPAAYEKRLEEEPFLADHVVAASRFTQWTLEASGLNPAKISVLPLGFEAEKIPFSQGVAGFGKRPLRLLYAGTVTQRKGIAYLLDAVEKFDKRDVELHIIGGIQGSGSAFLKRSHLYTHHLPVSQSELFARYGDYDALVLPTVFEGFGLVIVEAMAAGLPVITTSHSMGPDVITQAKNGYLVPIRDVEALVSSISALQKLTEPEYLQFRKEAREAALRFTWDRFRMELADLIRDF